MGGGGGNSAIIDTANKTSLNELYCILKRSLLHIDIEGGCVHIAKSLGTKSLVLFGITAPELVGYEENINIMSSLCNGCVRYECPLYEEPVCVNAITPDFVAQKAADYLNTLV
ncbi:MAG: hypothetical protein LBH29_02575 [Elusimicrobiota bacterium]|jgi:ADP-heptose:LPS heptosyltransferase|nr:hypothetical protein [Elusimicrobiota bacterium]